MGLWPESVGPEASDARANWALHVAARETLSAAVAVLGAAGVPFLVVKGAVTGHWLYDDPAERPLGDVDLRIKPVDFRRAVSAFERAGWETLDFKPAYKAFASGRRNLCVDVESVIGAPGLCGLSVEEMLTRAAQGPPEVAALVPELHDHALVLAINVFKDKLALASPWAVEDARRVAELPAFDARRLAGLAANARVRSLVWIVADWMTREKGSSGWARVREELGGDRPPRPLYAGTMLWLEKHAALDGVVVRVAARLASDEPRMWPMALWAAGTLALGRRWKGRVAAGEGHPRPNAV